jgi:hypothetical protein
MWHNKLQQKLFFNFASSFLGMFQDITEIASLIASSCSLPVINRHGHCQ